MALITRSSEMSFSLSRLFSTLRSMSIGSLQFLRLLALRQAPELHLDRARAEHRVGETAADILDVQDYRFIVSQHDPAHQDIAAGKRDLHQASRRTAPVPWFSERTVHPWRGDLQRIREITHDPRRIQRS